LRLGNGFDIVLVLKQTKEKVMNEMDQVKSALDKIECSLSKLEQRQRAIKVTMAIRELLVVMRNDKPTPSFAMIDAVEEVLVAHQELVEIL
jgi:phage shock protein A